MEYDFVEALEAYSGLSFKDEYLIQATQAVEAMLTLEYEYNFDSAMEGATSDTFKEWRKMSADIKEQKAIIREAAGKKDYKTAAEACRKISSIARELDSKIKSAPYDLPGALLVYIATTLIAMLVAGLAAFGAGKAKVYTKQLRKKVNRMSYGVDNYGRTYRGKSGADAVSAIHKDAARLQGTDAATLAAGAVGLSGVVKAISLAMKKKKNPEDFTDNDRNTLISAIRASAKDIARKYEEKAVQYASMKDEEPASECWLFS